MTSPFKQVFKAVVLSGSGARTEMLRQKGKDPYTSLLRGTIIASLTSVLYAFLFLFIDYSKAPNSFLLFLGFFGVMWLATLVPTAFHVILSSKDMLWYQHLPVKEETILLAKLAFLGVAANGTILPMFASIMKFSHDIHFFLWPVVGILLTLGVTALVYLVSGLLLVGMSSNKIPPSFQRFLLRVQTILATIVIFVVVFSFQRAPKLQGEPFAVVAFLIAHPLLVSGVFFAVSAVLLFLFGKREIPRLYERVGRIESVSRGGRRKGKGSLLRYNIGLITDSKTFAYAVDGFFLNGILLISVGINLREMILSAAAPLKPFIAAQIGLASTWLLLYNASIRTSFLSLDGEAGTYFEALPITLAQRIREKAKVLTGLLFLQATILLLVAHLLFKLFTPKIFILNVFLTLISAFFAARAGLQKDSKDLFYDWTNPTDILLRGTSRGKAFATLFGEIILLCVFFGVLNVLAAHGTPLAILYGVIYVLWAVGIVVFALLGA